MTTIVALPTWIADARLQSVLTAGSGAVVLVAGSALAAASSGSAPTPLTVAASLVSVQLGIWALAVIALGFAAARLTAATFALFAVLLAPVATVAENVIASNGVNPLVWAIAVGWRAVGFTGAALVGAVVGALVRRDRMLRTTAVAASPLSSPDVAPASPSADRRSRGRLVLGLVLATLLAGGAALAFTLPGQWFAVYFQIWGDTPVASEADASRFGWTAGIALALIAAALIVAIVRRGAGLIVLTALAFIVALLVAFVFQVPQGRFVPSVHSPAYVDDYPENDDYPVCFGTTGDCPGG